MSLNQTIADVTDRIIERSRDRREGYLDRVGRAAEAGPVRAHLTCGNQAHAYAGVPTDQDALAGGGPPTSASSAPTTTCCRRINPSRNSPN